MKTTALKVTAIVEKGSDGLYSVYSDSIIDKHGFGGFGDNVDEAKEDFELSIKEAIELSGSKISFNDIRIEYKYDIPSLFNFLDYINVSKFAEYAGINESKMRAYKSGLVFPGEKTVKRIVAALESITQKLNSVSLRI
jgi:hypothetical protein